MPTCTTLCMVSPPVCVKVPQDYSVTRSNIFQFRIHSTHLLSRKSKAKTSSSDYTICCHLEPVINKRRHEQGVRRTFTRSQKFLCGFGFAPDMNMLRRTTPQNGTREVHGRIPFFPGANPTQPSVANPSPTQPERGRILHPPAGRVVRDGLKCYNGPPPPSSPFRRGGREGGEKATEPESFGPSKTCSCSHARMCYTTCFGELRRKMACERCMAGSPFFRVRIGRNRRSRIHRRHSRSGGAFCTRPAPPPPESDGTQKAMWISSSGATAVAYWVDTPAR